MHTVEIQPNALVLINDGDAGNSFDLVVRNAGPDRIDLRPVSSDEEPGFPSEWSAAGTAVCQIWLPLAAAFLPPEQKRRFLAVAEGVEAVLPKGWTGDRHDNPHYGSCWAFWPDGEAALEPGESVCFSFTNVSVPAAIFTPGRASFVGVRFHDAPIRYLPVFVRPPAFSIPDFYAENGMSHGVGDAVRLRWRISGNTTDEGAVARLVPANLDALLRSEALVYPRQTTTYTLYAEEGDTFLSRSVHVSVSDGEILDFHASAEEVGLNEPVILRAKLRGTDHAWLDHGIGFVTSRQLQEGVTVYPDRAKTDYTLLCEAASGFSAKTCTVTVRDKLTVEKLTLAPQPESGLCAVEWGVKNALSVQLSTQDGTVVSREHCGKVFRLAGQVLRLVCTGKNGQECVMYVLPQTGGD